MRLSTHEGVLARLDSLYQRRGDTEFAPLVAGLGLSDEALAEVIETDARRRLALGLAVDFDRYLRAVPTLASMPVALDAALEFTLRAAVHGGVDNRQATIKALTDRHPHLAAAIRTAAALSDAIFATRDLRSTSPDRSVAGRRKRLPAHTFPHPFGPSVVTPDGPASPRPRYELVRLVGSGDQGAVYKAADLLLSEPDRPAWVAVKVLFPSASLAAQTDPDPRDLAPLLAEATRARRVEHENVVRVLDRGVSPDGYAYITFEYVDGESLEEIAARAGGKLEPARAAALIAAVARGIGAAHAAGVLHRDLKPANVLLTRDDAPGGGGVPKVTDFGVARPLDADHAEMTDTPGPHAGNVAFMAPERYRGEWGSESPAADVYALGGMLAYLITGVSPNGETRTQIARRHAAADRSPAPPAPAAPGPARIQDPDLAAIVARALAPRVADRYGSAEGLAADLDAWLRHEVIAWRRPRWTRRAKLFTRRQPVAAILLVALGVGLTAGGATIAWITSQSVQHAKRAAEREEILAYCNTVVDEIIQFMDQAEDGALAAEFFPELTLTEAILGPAILRPRADSTDIWSARIPAARELLARETAEGRGDEVLALTLGTALTFWEVRAGSSDAATLLAARDRVASLIAAWEPRLPRGAEDTWIRRMRTLQACATVRLAALEPAAYTADLAPAEAVLARHEQVFGAERRPGAIAVGGYADPLHRLALESLVALYGPTLLDRPDDASAIQETLDRVTR